jgi:hypothetical protein
MGTSKINQTIVRWMLCRCQLNPKVHVARAQLLFLAIQIFDTNLRLKNLYCGLKDLMGAVRIGQRHFASSGRIVCVCAQPKSATWFEFDKLLHRFGQYAKQTKERVCGRPGGSQYPDNGVGLAVRWRINKRCVVAFRKTLGGAQHYRRRRR